MRDLLSYNLLFVGQLYMVYEDKFARSWFDLHYNWPSNSELLLNKSLPELIYFLSKYLLASMPKAFSTILRALDDR